jgi:putative OPT family oligopeptide transporter
MIGAVVCCAAAVAGDNLQDLKCGYMIGATPWRQQLMLAIGAASCALVMAPVLNLLSKAYGIGVVSAEHPNPLLAPQATLMASVAKGLFGGVLPWGMIWTGAALGAVIIAADEVLKRRGAKFRIPVLGAAVGIYLPLDLTVPIFLGGLLTHLVERVSRFPKAVDDERMHRKGVLFSAGLITGEALMGILIAIPIVATGRADVLALPTAWLETFKAPMAGLFSLLRINADASEFIGLIVLGVIGWLLYRNALRGAREAAANPEPPAAASPSPSH